MQWVTTELRANERDERVDALAFVDPIARKDDERARGQFQHGRGLLVHFAFVLWAAPMAITAALLHEFKLVRARRAPSPLE